MLVKDCFECYICVVHLFNEFNKYLPFGNLLGYLNKNKIVTNWLLISWIGIRFPVRTAKSW